MKLDVNKTLDALKHGTGSSDKLVGSVGAWFARQFIAQSANEKLETLHSVRPVLRQEGFDICDSEVHESVGCDFCLSGNMLGHGDEVQCGDVRLSMFDARDGHDAEVMIRVMVGDDYEYGFSVPVKYCPKCGRRLHDDGVLMPPKWLWRLEAKDPEHGLWYDSDGKMVFDIGRLDCSTKDLPMDYDWRYQQDGKSWWSSCSDKDDLTHWYSIDDAKRLIDAGFVFTRYLATEYHEYEMETVFLKESCLAREELSLEEVFSS